MRVQLELNDEAIKYLDAMKEETAAASRTEVIRNAMAILRWAIDKAHRGYKIMAVKEGQEVAKELSMPILEQVAIKEEKPSKNR